MKNALIVVLIFLILLVGGVYYFKNTKSPAKPDINNPPSNLKEMGDSDLGYSFMLPDNFTVEKNGDFSRLYMKKTNSPGAGPTNFIYISIVPQGKEIADGEIYNYNEKDFSSLDKLGTNESVTLGDIENDEIAKYYKYVRIDDQMIGGYGAKAFKNELPWEFPNGTTEYRYTIPITQAKFIIGAYTSDDPKSDYTITKSELDSLFKNLKLTPDTIKFVFTSPKPEGDWREFSNNSPFIKFDYPSDWNRLTESQNFPEGDLFAINVVGQTQRPQTELYDGAVFGVMKPIEVNENINSWVENRYNSQDNPELPENKPEFSKVSFANKTYEKIIVCGLGCFTYYHTIQNGYLYGFVANVVGPHESAYNQVISKIMSSVDYGN